MSKIKILIVEDELLIAHNLSRKLQKLDYEVIQVVTSGQEALKVIAETKPDLVLMDIVIQGDMDGIETATKIYQNFNIPVVYLTAYADDKTIERAESSNSYGYILKPFLIRELHATIRMAMQKHKKTSELAKSVEIAEQMTKKLQDVIQGSFSKFNVSPEIDLEKDLSLAVEKEELQILYQPIIDLKNDQIVAAEALLRWQHPSRGMISPTLFIPMAEKTGLIDEIGHWTLKNACQQTKNWQSIFSLPISISVNISPHQFKDRSLVKQINEILQETQLEAHLLKLELTETLLVEDKNLVAEMLSLLKTLGVQLAIDDFGTGYSGVAYLQDFPFDIIKIDRCFVNQVTENPDKLALAKAIIAIGRSLKLGIIAEGVESQKELNFLIDNDCDFVQGYFFSHPLPANEFEKLVLSSQEVLKNRHSNEDDNIIDFPKSVNS